MRVGKGRFLFIWFLTVKNSTMLPIAILNIIANNLETRETTCISVILKCHVGRAKV